MRKRHAIHRAIRDGQIRQNATEENTVSVEELGADPSAVGDDTTAIQTALTEVLANGGKLFFPKGTWNLTAPLIITSRIEVAGAGMNDTIIRYSGTGAAIRLEFTDATVGEGTYLHDFMVRGFDGATQSGIVGGTNGNGVPRTLIEHVQTESFSNGYGIYLYLAADTVVFNNKIGLAQNGIVLDTCAGCSVTHNFMSYWAVSGIHAFSVGSVLAPRNNEISQNLIHGNVLVAQTVPSTRHAVLLQRVGNTQVVNNYIEIILAASTGELGHGIVVDGALGVTQVNTVAGNYFGPGLTGKALRILNSASHTRVSANQFGTYEIEDAGFATVFDFQLLDTFAKLTGVSTTRMGYISLGTSAPTKLHST